MEQKLDFVGVKKGVYARKFEKVEQGRISWNWCAFLAGGGWLLYRKMYREFAVLFMITLALNAMSLTGVKALMVVEIIASLIVWIGLGMYGDKIYYNKITALANAYEGKSDRPQAIERYGGVSLLAVLIAFVASFVLAFVASAVIGVAML